MNKGNTGPVAQLALSDRETFGADDVSAIQAFLDDKFKPNRRWTPVTIVNGKAVLGEPQHFSMEELRQAITPAPTAPTDLSTRLREWADTRPLAAHYADIMRAGAEEIERYYGGMMNWKANAQQKDRTIADMRQALEKAHARLLELESPPVWKPLTKAGQIQKGDRLRFTIGDKSFTERAKLILHPGTDKEEVIYNKAQNFYFITAMAINGTSSHKGVEFMKGGA